ncbi:MAG: hypothetical protein QNJ72_41490 [Pleurocapsa sp. MO_226.B13]|nr:hypothetical protein [Pleurocapsa sp. MO_226.B13]
MSNLIKRKQLDWVFSAGVQVQSFSTSASSTDDVTSVITSALSSAGRGGSSVPLVISGGEESQGVITTGDFARIEIESAINKDKIAGDENNNEVYARLSESSGTYTLTYFYLDDTGAEQSYSFASPTDINFSFNYRFVADKLPADAIIGQLGMQISQDPGGNRQKVVRERLTVTATNTLTDLTQSIAEPTQLQLIINGVDYHTGTGQPVTLTGQTPGWNSAAFGTEKAWDIETTDTVFAVYPINS